jgi:hypothetical protein
MRKDRRQLFEGLLFPLRDLVGMHPVLTGQLGNRFLPLDRLKGYASFEGCAVLLPLL